MMARNSRAGGSDVVRLYAPIISKLFLNNYVEDAAELPFTRSEIVAIAANLGIPLPKNLGDVLYAFRYRREFPDEILELTPDGLSWIILGAGRSKYRFMLGDWPAIVPQEGREQIKIYDATPEIIRRYAKADEQAALARVRYNRLVDTFLGITSYSLQNHLRTSVKSIGQIEVDELYVGVSQSGAQYVVPIQAKVDADRHSVVQTLQDAAYCEETYPNLVRRCVSAHFLRAQEVIVMFELSVTGHEVKIRNERHYKLVDSESISDTELRAYRDADSR